MKQKRTLATGKKVGIRAKKSLGQNFLHNKGVLRTMVRAGNIERNDLVLEIGPGKGSLTEILLESGARVVAIEKDDRLIPFLSEKFAQFLQSGALTLIHGDFLLEDIFKITKGAPYSVIANIPYYITGAILTKFLEDTHQPKTMVIMLQKEVAQRIIARDKKESILSLSIHVFAKPSIVQKVSRELFSPKPNVDSTVLLLSDIHNPFQSIQEKNLFFEIIKKAFNQKRKTIGNTLKEIPKDILLKSGIEQNMRPEDISISSWLTLTRLYLPE